MKGSLATAVMFYRLARGFAFSPGVVELGCSRGGRALIRPRHSLLGGASGMPSAADTPRRYSGVPHGPASSKMILRPDWEREGRVFGLQPPPPKSPSPSEKNKERAFEYLVDYPCDFEIKVIGVNEGSFAVDIATTVSVACEVATGDVRYSVRDTSSGKYQSVTVQAPVKNATMLYLCYQLIGEDPRVKFKF